MRGRHPKSAEERLAAGNPGKRPMNLEEPDLEPSGHEPPPDLEGKALELWNARVVDLVDKGLLATAEREVFAEYCETWADLQERRKQLGEIRRMNLDATTKAQIMRPIVIALDRAKKDFKGLAETLGLTSTTRGRVKAIKKADKGDNLRKRFFGVSDKQSA